MIIEPEPREDARGSFARTSCASTLAFRFCGAFHRNEGVG